MTERTANRLRVARATGVVVVAVAAVVVFTVRDLADSMALSVVLVIGALLAVISNQILRRRHRRPRLHSSS